MQNVKKELQKTCVFPKRMPQCGDCATFNLKKRGFDLKSEWFYHTMEKKVDKE